MRRRCRRHSSKPSESKRFIGTLLNAQSDEHESFSYPISGEEDDASYETSKARLTDIIRPRVQQIMGLVRERLTLNAASRYAGDKVVLTGGASQLLGLPEFVASEFGRPVRVGRPTDLPGLNASLSGPQLATLSGLAIVASRGDGELSGARGRKDRDAGVSWSCWYVASKADFKDVSKTELRSSEQSARGSKRVRAKRPIINFGDAMSIKLQLPKLVDAKPRITVIGVGGAGCNAVSNMIAAGLQGVQFVVANTDAQSLDASSAEHRIQLGVNLTEGLGAGARPEIGEAAAEEALEELRTHIAGAHMVFIAAGMGGGTGTGAAAVIARIARELGALTVGVVCKPFQFEGARRMRIADAGVESLRHLVDTLIVIPNQNLFRIANERTTFAEAFVLADQVLYSGVACIVELVLKEGLINLDFADVRDRHERHGHGDDGNRRSDRRAARSSRCRRGSRQSATR